MLLAWLVPCVVLALTVHRAFAALGGLGLLSLWGLVLMDIRARRRPERSDQHDRSSHDWGAARQNATRSIGCGPTIETMPSRVAAGSRRPILTPYHASRPAYPRPRRQRGGATASLVVLHPPKYRSMRKRAHAPLASLPGPPLVFAPLFGAMMIMARPALRGRTCPTSPTVSRSAWSRLCRPCSIPARSRQHPTAHCSWAKTRWTRSGRPTSPSTGSCSFRDGKDPVVFADKFNAIFGMVWHDGALYVMNMPHLTVFRDRDGDGKAEERKELFTNLGVPAGSPNDFNDHIVSGLKIGIDRYLYISVGDKGVPKADRSRRPDGAGQGGRRPALPAGRHGARGLFHRHAQPPRAQPRRPRQPLYLRQHRRRPRLVDAGHPSCRRRLLWIPV